MNPPHATPAAGSLSGLRIIIAETENGIMTVTSITAMIKSMILACRPSGGLPTIRGFKE